MSLATSIDKHQPSAFECIEMAVVVHYLAVLGKNCLETNVASVSNSNAFEQASDVLFLNSGLATCNGCCVHQIADVRSLFEFGNFFGLLYRAHLNDGFYQLNRMLSLCICHAYSKPLGNLQCLLGSVNRKVVDCATALLCRVDEACHLLYRTASCNSNLHGKSRNVINRTVPDEVVDVDIVSEEIFLVVVYVYNANKSVSLLSEVVEE